MSRLDPRTDNPPKNATKARALRLRLGTDGSRWSQRHLAAHIAKNPIPDAEGRSVAWLKKMEGGFIPGDTFDALVAYLTRMVEREASGEKIPRPRLLEKNTAKKILIHTGKRARIARRTKS